MVLAGALAISWVWAVLFDSPQKSDYVSSLFVDRTAIRFDFGDKSTKRIPWSAVRSVTAHSYMVTAQISPDDYSATGSSGHLYYKISEQTLTLFYWSHFENIVRVVNALEFYGGPLITRK